MTPATHAPARGRRSATLAVAMAFALVTACGSDGGGGASPSPDVVAAAADATGAGSEADPADADPPAVVPPAEESSDEGGPLTDDGVDGAQPGAADTTEIDTTEIGPTEIGPPDLDTSVAGLGGAFGGPDPAGGPVARGVCTEPFVEATDLVASRVDCTAATSVDGVTTVAIAMLASGGSEVWWFAGPHGSMSACARVGGTPQGVLDMTAAGVATGLAVSVIASDGDAWPYVGIPAPGCPDIEVPGQLPEFTAPMPQAAGIYVRVDTGGSRDGVCYEPDSASGSWIQREGFLPSC